MKTYGLRDIIGPIMVGPSSSHTAGALALASMARKLFGEQPERAVFTLYGSFAATGSGHGTDKALVAGILGLATDDPRVADAFALAKAASVQVEIVWDTTTEVAHPNTVDIRCESREGRFCAVAVASPSWCICRILAPGQPVCAALCAFAARTAASL